MGRHEGRTALAHVPRDKHGRAPRARGVGSMSSTGETVYDKLRKSIAQLDEKLREGNSAERDVHPRILAERTKRIAKTPLRVDRAPESFGCIVFERSGRRYAVQLESVDDVG